MKRLSLLILCLLVTCKAFSQNDTIQKTEYVFLTEEQARANIKELIEFDGLKKQYSLQEERITGFKLSIKELNDIIQLKNDIISNKDSIISYQESIIKRKHPLEIHSYLGTELYKTHLETVSFYYKVSLETKMFNFIAKGIFDPSSVHIYYNLQLEYKIF